MHERRCQTTVSPTACKLTSLTTCPFLPSTHTVRYLRYVYVVITGSVGIYTLDSADAISKASMNASSSTTSTVPLDVDHAQSDELSAILRFVDTRTARGVPNAPGKVSDMPFDLRAWRKGARVPAQRYGDWSVCYPGEAFNHQVRYTVKAAVTVIEERKRSSFNYACLRGLSKLERCVTSSPAPHTDLLLAHMRATHMRATHMRAFCLPSLLFLQLLCLSFPSPLRRSIKKSRARRRTVKMTMMTTTTTMTTTMTSGGSGSAPWWQA